MNAGDYRRELADLFYPGGMWCGWNTFFSPPIPSRLFSRGFWLIKNVIEGFSEPDNAIDFLISTHTKRLSQNGRAESDVECVPTLMAEKAVIILRRIQLESRDGCAASTNR